MSTSDPNSGSSFGGGVDKNELYGNFQKQADAKAKLGMQAARKALDIAEDDVHINAAKTTTVNGLSPRAVIAIALVSALVPSIFAAAQFFRPVAAAVAPVAVPAAAPVQPGAGAADPKQFKVDFWVDDGKVQTKVTPE